MRHARTPRKGLPVLFAAAAAVSAASTGCTHNYYYGALPSGCAPTPGVTTPGVQYGSVCEVPSQVVDGGTVIATNPPRTAPALSGPRPPRIVTSDTPGSGPSWRRSDPDAGLATTRVDGGKSDDPTVTK